MCAIPGIVVAAESTISGVKARIITAREVEEGTTTIIGKLGLPLMTAVEIEATIIEDFSIYDNTPTGIYLLRVVRVDGTELKEPVTMSFRVQSSSNATVAESSKALDDRLKVLRDRTLDEGWESTTNPDGTLFSVKIRTSQDEQLFRKSFLGSRHRLVVSEVATLNGQPKNLPKDVAPLSTGLEGHYSRTFSLAVLAERKL